jgi:hypothetical protein
MVTPFIQNHSVGLTGTSWRRNGWPYLMGHPFPSAIPREFPPHSPVNERNIPFPARNLKWGVHPTLMLKAYARTRALDDALPCLQHISRAASDQSPLGVNLTGVKVLRCKHDFLLDRPLHDPCKDLSVGRLHHGGAPLMYSVPPAPSPPFETYCAGSTAGRPLGVSAASGLGQAQVTVVPFPDAG